MMASYEQRQQQLFDFIEISFKNGDIPSTVNDPVTDYVNDDRICLTSVVFLPQACCDLIYEKVITPLKKADPDLFYYPPQSLHLTIQNIRTIENPPNFTPQDIETTRRVLLKVIPKHKSIKFNLRGLFELPTSIAMKGFCDESLKNIVLELRQELTKAGLPDNKKYASEEVFFGNVTVCRFPKIPNSDFIETVKSLKDLELGELEIKTVSLVTGNIVFSEVNTQIIEQFNLKPD